MDDQELEQLFADLESDRVERKESIHDRDRIRQAICAFANDLPGHGKPGVIFVGVRDDGTPAPLTIDDRLLLTLADMRADGRILPIPSFTVQKRVLRGHEFVVVAVEPSDAPPVSFDGRVWIRVGPRRAGANPHEERRLAERRRSRDLPFDVQPVRGATLADLDGTLFERVYLPAAVAPEVLAENQRSQEQQMAALRLATAEPEVRPTVLGVLAIGKDVRDFFPCAYVQFVRYDGRAFDDPIRDQREISGPLPDLLHEMETILEAHITTASTIAGVSVERRVPDYPLGALQQLARNAVMHRTYEATHAPIRISWYDDRIEMQNPGGLFGAVSPNNFPAAGTADYRNPHLAEAMKHLGYVQRFGIGILLANEALRRNGNPPAEFAPDPTHFLVTLRSNR